MSRVFGIVVDIKDPLEINRVRVRWFGVHSPFTADIPIEDLHWSIVEMPVTSASISGVGLSSHGLVAGSMVTGEFMDELKQTSIVLGTISSEQAEAMQNEYAFKDPSGEYPRWLGEQDSSRLCSVNRTTDATNTLKEESLAKHADNISIENTWNPSYPDNMVYESKAGHVIEIDNTAGSERIHLKHSSGSFIEMVPDGSIVIHQNDKNDLVDGNANTSINGSSNSVIDQSSSIVIGTDGTIKIGGSYNIEVGGSATCKVGGSLNVDVGGSTSIKTPSFIVDTSSFIANAPSIELNGFVKSGPIAVTT